MKRTDTNSAAMGGRRSGAARGAALAMLMLACGAFGAAASSAREVGAEPAPSAAAAAQVAPERGEAEPAEQNPRVTAARERAAATAKERAGELSREEVRERLLKRLEETQKIEEGIRAAIARLDAGGDNFEVWTELEKLRPVVRDLLSPISRRGQTPMRPGQPAAVEGRGGAAQQGGQGAEPQRMLNRAEMRERVMKFLDENMPVMAQRLREAEKTDRAAIENTVAKIGPRIEDLLKTKREEPDFFPVRLQELRLGLGMFEAARQLGEVSKAAAPDAELAKTLEDQLMKMGYEMFDVREKIQERDLRRVNERATQLQRELSEQRGNRDQIVRDRVNALIQRAKNAGKGGNRDGEAGGGRGGAKRGE